MSELDKAVGRCLCGAVTFTALKVSTQHVACHCKQCQQWSGGVWMAALASGGVDFTGEENIVRYRASEWGERGFCKICGSNLYWRNREDDYYAVAVGALDDPSPLTLSMEFYADRERAGYAFSGSHKVLTEAETLELFAPKD